MHGDLEEHTLPWFDWRGKDFETLQKVILGPQLLDSFKYYMYVRFRYRQQIPFNNNISYVSYIRTCIQRVDLS